VEESDANRRTCGSEVRERCHVHSKVPHLGVTARLFVLAIPIALTKYGQTAPIFEQLICLERPIISSTKLEKVSDMLEELCTSI
jgi:hypothetical protein